MAEATIDKATCENCGAEVRDGTSFCYSCGKPVGEAVANAEPADTASNGTATVSADAQAALDDLAERLKIEEAPADDPLAQAAAERKKARVRGRRSEVVWDAGDGGGKLFILVTLLIFVMTAVVVFVAVYWK